MVIGLDLEGEGPPFRFGMGKCCISVLCVSAAQESIHQPTGQSVSSDYHRSLGRSSKVDVVWGIGADNGWRWGGGGWGGGRKISWDDGLYMRMRRPRVGVAVDRVGNDVGTAGDGERKRPRRPSSEEPKKQQKGRANEGESGGGSGEKGQTMGRTGYGHPP